jgi:hypothetical protein
MQPVQDILFTVEAKALNTAINGSRRPVLVAASSLFFTVLQSVCTAVIAINGVRFAIGLSALLMNVGVGSLLFRFHHIEWLRILMICVALAGSLINLGALWQVRRLRNRPSARWRLRPRTKRETRDERLQLWLSLLTLLFLGIEESLHFVLCHTL